VNLDLLEELEKSKMTPRVREADAERWEIVRAVKEECPIEGSFVQRSLSHSTRISRDLILQKESRDVHQIGKFQNP
jgi:hypothetical protein